MRAGLNYTWKPTEYCIIPRNKHDRLIGETILILTSSNEKETQTDTTHIHGTQTIHKHNRSILATLNRTKRVQHHHVSFATQLDDYTTDMVETDHQTTDERAGTSHAEDEASRLAQLLGSISMNST